MSILIIRLKYQANPFHIIIRVRAYKCYVKHQFSSNLHGESTYILLLELNAIGSIFIGEDKRTLSRVTLTGEDDLTKALDIAGLQ